MRIIIIGCGRLGSVLAQTLSMRGHAVTAVDNDPASFERLGPAFKGQTVLGVGFDRDLLLQAGIERADGLAAVTTSDDTNVVTARLASLVFRVPRVVARVYDPRKAEIYRRLGLQTISPVSLGTDLLAELLTFSQLKTILSLGSGEVGIVEAEVPPLLVGRTATALTIPGEVHLVAVSRSSKTFLPTPATVFQQGDLIHLAVLAASTERLEALLGLV
jgi:trk system potassium uptake protein TrkA